MVGNLFQKVNQTSHKQLLFIALFYLFLGVMPVASAKVTEVTVGTHYRIEEYYVLEQDALQACNKFAASRGYYDGHNQCRKSDSRSFYEVGWLWARLNPIIYEPYALGVFNFNLSCPEGTVLNNNTGVCFSLQQSINAGQPELGSCAGNPVNTATGNKYAEEVDIISSGSLSFSRYYNAKGLSGDSEMGFSWNHTFNRNLFVNSETISATRPDGKLAYFRLTGSVWVNQQAGGDRLIQVAGGSSWQLITADDKIETYNTSGRLLSITNRDGRSQTLSYDANNRLSTVTDDTGRALSFTYDSASRIKTMTDPAGGIYQYTYDAAGNLASVTYPDGKIRTYHYNESAYTSGSNLPYALTGITDENGMRFATYSYDAQGRAIVTEHAGGVERYSLSYSTDGTSTVVTDPLNSQYTHTFQTILGVAKSTGQSQPAGSGCSAASSNISYDVNGNIASRTDFIGNKTCYAYDLTRNLEIGRTEGLSSSSNCPGDIPSYIPTANSSERKTLTTWHANFRIPTSITEAGRETNFIYDTHGNVTQHQIKDTATNATRTWTTSYVYHATIPGIILQKTENGPRTDVSDITTTQYYLPDAACAGGHKGCRAQVASITNALGHVTQITRYNAHGQPEEIIDPNGLTTVLIYDTRQRLLSRTANTELTRYQYDNAGQLKKITFPDSSFLSYTYDTAHRLTAIIRRTKPAVERHWCTKSNDPISIRCARQPETSS